MVLYSTGCPKCGILEKRLKKDGFIFQVSNDVDYLIEKGFENAPVLEVNGKLHKYEDAMEMLKKYEKGEGTIE